MPSSKPQKRHAQQAANPEPVKRMAKYSHRDRLVSNAKKCGMRIRRDVLGDGNCYFRALADQLQRIATKDVPTHQELRAKICDHMQAYTPDDQRVVISDDYIKTMRLDATWAGAPEIIATTKAYGVNIKIVTSAERSTASGFLMHQYKEDGATKTLYFGHIHEHHYISLEPDPYQSVKEKPASQKSSRSGKVQASSAPKNTRNLGKQSTLQAFFSTRATSSISTAQTSMLIAPTLNTQPPTSNQTVKPTSSMGAVQGLSTSAAPSKTPSASTSNAQPPVSSQTAKRSSSLGAVSRSPISAGPTAMSRAPTLNSQLPPSSQAAKPTSSVGAVPGLSTSAAPTITPRASTCNAQPPTSSQPAKQTSSMGAVSRSPISAAPTATLRAPTINSQPSASIQPDKPTSSMGAAPSRHLPPSSTGSIPLPREPYQPSDVTCLPAQKLPNKTLTFQPKWYEQFPWLHVDLCLDGVICFTCSQASRQHLMAMAKCKEDTFITAGFKNWKKAIEKFKKHQSSEAHAISCANLSSRSKDDDISTQLNQQLQEEQAASRKALITIVSSMKYLAKQGLAMRGKDATDGNFMNLLNLRASDVPSLRTWLNRKTTYTSGSSQNELLKLMSHDIIRNICKEVNNESTYFGVVIDGTQDCSGTEQESVCIRYIDESFDVKEEFLGLYEMPSTTGVSLCKMLCDILIRLQLPLENLRAQTYDGARNMCGKYTGCQAEVKKHQPLATYTHCGAHVSHLITSKAVQGAVYVRDALDHVQELGKIYTGSGKFKHLYLGLHDEDNDNPSPSQLKPICPTRWLTRSISLQAVLNNYVDVLEALKKASEEFATNVATRANCLRKCMLSGKTVLGLVTAKPIITCLEKFNRGLQGTGVSVDEMLISANIVKTELQALRTAEEFRKLFNDATSKVQKWKLDPLAGRKKIIPARYADGAPQHVADSTEDKYRADFFQMIDNALTNLTEYFTSTDLEEYKRVSSMLLSGTFHPDLVQKYPELSDSLESELAFFRRQFEKSSVEEYRKLFKSMTPAVRRMFPQVEKLLRLLLISPASSCVAERSFSGLRRIKTWLRNTMTQKRLNHVMVCHVHRDRLEQVNDRDIAQNFISSSDSRSHTFGRFEN